MASDGMREIEVRLTAFEDYTAEGSSLTADRVTSSDGAALFEETNDGMKLTGAIPGEKEYNISVVISNSEFTDAAEKNGNYTVLSVIAFEDIVRVILGDNDKNNMYYIEFGSDTLTSVKPYKVNWYHSFLAPEVEFDLDKYSSSSKVPMAIKVEYMDTNIRLDTAGSHSVVVENSLKTHDNYIRYEQKKLSYRWDYYVASTGNCNGVDVTMISEPQYFLNHLYYTLTK